MLDMVRETSQDLPPEAWLIGEGWNETNFTDENIPTIQELDEIRKGPIALIRACRHVVLANTRALEAGGIYPTTPDPPGGKIGRDRYGNLTGLLFEEATLAVTNAFVTSGTDYIESLTNKLTLAIDDMLAKGLTGGHTEDLSYFGHYTNPLMAYHESIGKKKNFRITLLRHHSVFKKMMDQNHSYLEPFIEPGPMKIFADGALGARTAALSKPYVDDPKIQGFYIIRKGN